MSDVPLLVSAGWLSAHLHDDDIRAADASWYLSQAGRNPRAEYEAAHIPGAVFFDIEAISETSTDLPHMLPDASAFASAMRRIGIGDADFVVVYDGAGLYSAPRALWMMRAMGHSRCAVLDGGLPKWRREGGAIESSLPHIDTRAHFTPRFQPKSVRDFAAMRDNLRTRNEQVVDARSPARFRGEEAEPRPGVRAGHMPGAINLYYADLLTADGTLCPEHALKRIFAERGIDLNAPVVTSCGSGITAAIVWLALRVAGAKHTALYDGSWSEWGARADAPVKTGPQSI